MFSKALISYVALFLAVASSVHAHAAVAPALGVKGNPVRGNVQRPSKGSPCGNVNVAQTIGSSTAVPANADGTFTFTVTDFNAGADGSRKIKSITVDPTGTGNSKSFVAGTVVKSGDGAPAKTGSEKVTGKLPAGTKCTGGKSKNLCVVSFTTTAGFGNCGVISQAAKKRDTSDLEEGEDHLEARTWSSRRSARAA